jgi:ATP-dependent DNA helicase RecG
MALPINIEEILNGHTVEWERIECKKGWNPEAVIHTICAFANDINNWGGGYIFIGVAEKDGVPILPPAGLELNSIDSIQKEILNISHKIQPNYSPITQPYVFDGKNILVVWVPGGDNRPYKAPSTVGEKGQYKHYIRRGSSSVVASHREELLLFEMAKRIPFDDRINHAAKIDSLNFGLIRSFLEEIKSDLAEDAAHIPLPQLAIQMRIAAGPPEAILPLNVGLLFFSDKPEVFFPGAITEIVIFQDNTGKEFTEIKFAGPLHIQLRNVLSFLQNNIIKEKVVKLSSRAEAERVFNYPFAAIEEIVANAFYHRSYELNNSIEIGCHSDRIEVLSFPAPLPPVTQEMLKLKRIVARDYRNRRIGDFLKELKLTEGRATGFPTIYDSLQQNGSPKPKFETDEQTYFLATLPIHPYFVDPERPATERDLQILMFCLSPRKRSDILEKIGFSSHSKNYERYILPLIQKGWLTYTDPDSPTSPNQRYVTTGLGKIILGK